ncbi:hypothetical protein M406DRAFT_336908 [Cryphonectria parasitica EP155]|uniref:Secreted protein n=1 Tax=Cryphonectria parasitica (strain ATCC 38755 / EP155) TaxID=660469 RepID=A0A9P5CRC7_CRYP1|nr:uncharacterized protein M406DRAFT_336908 [Cryphonectria parasitica EP155]KAF3768424.1 hypothetical protein M406DRAFT_336908 [Cryphonectria parasitica EP155]
MKHFGPLAHMQLMLFIITSACARCYFLQDALHGEPEETTSTRGLARRSLCEVPEDTTSRPDSTRQLLSGEYRSAGPQPLQSLALPT